jgi:hypothetical protein
MCAVREIIDWWWRILSAYIALFLKINGIKQATLLANYISCTLLFMADIKI